MSEVFRHFVTHELRHTHSHTHSRTHVRGYPTLGANTPGVAASSRPVIANYCLRACGFGFRDCQLCITQPVFADGLGAFRMSCRALSILLGLYYHIIILGGELLILLVTAQQSSLRCDAAFARPGRARTF